MFRWSRAWPSEQPDFLDSVRRLRAYARRALPEGRTLPPAVWRRRHRVLLAVLWLHALAIPVFGVANGYGVLHSVQEGVALAAIGSLAWLVPRRRRLSAALVSLGLITSSALVVHLSGGVIEAHFHFFVMIAVLTLYEDWLPFLLAAAYVVVHHGLTGALDPDSVFNHPDAVAHPWKWAGIHAAFVTAAGIAGVATWRLNESVREESNEAYRRAYESEQLFRGAFAEAPIGMALASLGEEDRGRFLQVNRALCEFTGHSEEQLLRMSFSAITYPEDREEATGSLPDLSAGERSSNEVEKRYVRADGSVVWGLVQVTPVRDGDQRPLYAIGQIQDITERKRAQEELAHQALHDALTDLGNRRKLLSDLGTALDSSSEQEGQMLLILFDLDGFKSYNDSFGHYAGDALLRRLGHRLAKAVSACGRAYRMGGDEFCVLARPGPEGSGWLEAAASEALTEHGEGFVISASHGAVLLPAEESTAAGALTTADHRMYAAKRGRRGSPQEQITRALARVIDERSPELATHLHDVSELCAAVGQRLGLTVGEVTSLRQAASLHDIGKIAIPDRILNKAGPLSGEESAFVRRHTLIGERIVSAASSLRQVAKMVRSSHERYDGRGFPDGLVGDDIPLGGRIIAVCDAYLAMTSHRPYRPSRSSDEALAEIRRCAGTQFDPVVVEAFAAVLADGVQEYAVAGGTSVE